MRFRGNFAVFCLVSVLVATRISGKKSGHAQSLTAQLDIAPEASALLDEAERLLNSQRGPEAVPIWEKALKYDIPAKMRFDVYNHMGIALSGFDIDGAERAWMQAVELCERYSMRPPHKGPYYNIGVVFEMRREFTEAIRWFELSQSIEHSPQTYMSLVHCAILMDDRHLGYDSLIERYLRAGLAMFPNASSLLHAYGSVSVFKGRWADASQWYGRFLFTRLPEHVQQCPKSHWRVVENWARAGDTAQVVSCTTTRTLMHQTHTHVPDPLCCT